jgi:hypothetical protein
MSRTFNLWTLAQAELLQIAARAHDFLAAHGLASGSEQHRQAPEDAGHLAAAAPLAHVDPLGGANTAFPPEPPALHVPHDF